MKYIYMFAVIIVAAILLFSYMLPLQWTTENEQITQTDHSYEFGDIGSNTISGFAQEFVLTKKTMITKASVYITIPSGINTWMKFHPVWFDEGEQYLIGNINEKFYFVILEDTVDTSKYYGGIAKGDSLPSINPDDWCWHEYRTSPVMTVYGTNTDSYSGGDLYEYSATGWSLISGDLAFKISGSTWYEPGQDELCWKCNNGVPESSSFPGGTNCGEGLAQGYPYDIEPICDVNNVWDLTLEARDGNNNVVPNAMYTIIGPDGTSGDSRTGQMGSSGDITLYDVMEGSYTLNGDASGYDCEGRIIHVNSDTTKTLLFTTEGTTLEFSVIIQDNSFAPIHGASVSIGSMTRITISDGTALFSDVPTGNYDIFVSASGYKSYDGSFSVSYPMSVAHITLESGDTTIPDIIGDTNMIYIIIGAVICIIAALAVLWKIGIL